MRQIKLSYFNKIDNEYSVRLGNNTVHTFKSLKATNKFLSDSSKFLTDKLHYLNNVYSSTFNLYRHTWLYFDYNCKVLDKNMYEYDRQIRESFSIIEDVFNKVSTRHLFDNYNIYVFKSFELISYYLQSIIISLKNLYKTKSVPSLLFQLDFLLDNLININNDINNYGVKTAL
jgi:hypothetical protein